MLVTFAETDSADGRSSARALGDRTATRQTRLDAVLRRLTARKVPGLSVAVMQADGAMTEQAAGFADLAGAKPATLDSAYMWFSMTKIATATAVMQLVERGALGLDDPVERYLPEFPRPRAGWPQVRVRHLLSHSAGLANPLPIRWVHPAGKPGREPHEFTLELLARHEKLRFAAGSKASYSNLGYIALGEVITAAAGQRYEDHVRQHILAPLGMTRTAFSYRPAMAGGGGAATGYQSRLSPLTPVLRGLLPDGITGANQGRFLSFRPFYVEGAAYGGLIGSARDAARFMSVHLNGGSAGGVRLLAPEGVAQMQVIAARGRRMDVGLGWFRRHARRKGGERYLEHVGGGAGFFNLMRIYPDRGLGVLIMGNVTRYDQEHLVAAAIS
jgi:CubicO group peptidase (beta-lactamase class C family)